MNNSAQPWSLEHSIVSAQIKRFVAEKVAQARAARSDPKEAPAEFKSVLVAAEKGDWPTLRDIFAKWREAAQRWEETRWVCLLHPVEFAVALEIESAIEQFAAGVEEYAAAFGRDVIASIPPGSIYFGGTDPGRGVITALCESHVHANPFFTLTQNAMIDGGYLHYLRSMYGSRIYIPTADDVTNAHNEYLEDARRRLKKDKLLPGEDFTEVEGQVQIRGQISVMAINGLLTKLTFAKNPDREFFVEASFPLEWMYPQLSPHGLIMTVNRQPMGELSDEVLQKDRDYWARYIQPLIGDWLNSNTTFVEIASFVEKVHVNHDLSGFKGDPRFVQNHPTQRLFSNLRCSIGDLYAWRVRGDKAPVQRDRMVKEADFACRQAFALCPASPNAAYHCVNLLAGEKRFDDAILVVEAALKLEPENAAFPNLLEQLKKMKIN